MNKIKVIVVSFFIFVIVIIPGYLILNKSNKQHQCLSGDCQNGIGVVKLPDGGRYEGRFRDGKFDGKGVFTHPKGHKYSGEWRNDQKDGFGELSSAVGIYSGQFLNNKRHGKGTYTWKDGSKLSVGWVEGVPNGKSIFTLKSGYAFTGIYKDGRIWNGEGVFIYKDGANYKGYWKRRETTW